MQTASLADVFNELSGDQATQLPIAFYAHYAAQAAKRSYAERYKVRFVHDRGSLSSRTDPVPKRSPAGEAGHGDNRNEREREPPKKRL